MPAGRPRIFTDEERLVRNAEARIVWRAANPELVKSYHRSYAAKEDVKVRKQNWAVENKLRINERRRQQYRLKKIPEGSPLGQSVPSEPTASEEAP